MLRKLQKDSFINEKLAEEISKDKAVKEIAVKPFVTDIVEYLDAMEEEKFHIGPAAFSKDEFGNILDTLVPVRFKGDFLLRTLTWLTILML